MAKKTELVFILDCSGSMQPLAADTVGGFNGTLAPFRKEEAEMLVTTVLFNGTSRTLHDRVPLSALPEMTAEDYQTFGCTALLDAIGGTVTHIHTIHRYARPEDVPERTVFFITTDGMENASAAYTADKVRQMIAAREKDGWEFHFLAANIAAVSTARSLGICDGHALQFDASPSGVQKSFACMARVISKDEVKRPKPKK